MSSSHGSKKIDHSCVSNTEEIKIDHSCGSNLSNIISWNFKFMKDVNRKKDIKKEAKWFLLREFNCNIAPDRLETQISLSNSLFKKLYEQDSPSVKSNYLNKRGFRVKRDVQITHLLPSWLFSFPGQNLFLFLYIIRFAGVLRQHRTINCLFVFINAGHYRIYHIILLR